MRVCGSVQEPFEQDMRLSSSEAGTIAFPVRSPFSEGGAH